MCVCVFVFIIYVQIYSMNFFRNHLFNKIICFI